MQGARFDEVEVRRPDLRAPFPERFAARLVGQTVRALTRRGKYLLAALSSDETLLMHLGMSGWFHVERLERRVERRGERRGGLSADRQASAGLAATAPDPHDHVIFRMSSGATVRFNDPRRFGTMELLSPARLAAHPTLSLLGPEPLSEAFDAAALARACRGKKTSLKAALLDQRIVAGLGNIYASEALHVAGLSPRRRAAIIATPAGAPRDAARRLTAAIKQVLTEAVERAAGSDEYRDARFRVYDREGQRCPRRGCPGTIVRRTQAGRSTFSCPVCQR